MFYFARNPFLIRQWYKKSLLWRIPNAKEEVFLTFDDGPTPEITPRLLGILKEHKVKATFFCVGENVQKHPKLFEQILLEGHCVGNHTFNHLNAWETDRKTYLKNIDKASELIPSKMFRPPYGKISPKLIKYLRRSYKIIMWTVLSGDFDPDVNPEQCFTNTTTKTKVGDILVFHDNLKAKKNVLYALPKTLDYFANLGIKVKPIPDKFADF